MHLLSEGRESYLEFLRNLGPQVLIMVVALIAGRELTPTCCYPENLKLSAVVISLWLAWFIAMVANVNNFITKFTDSVPQFKGVNTITGISVWERLKKLAVAKPFFFIELLVVLAIIEVCLIVVAFTAITTATSVINNLHIKP